MQDQGAATHPLLRAACRIGAALAKLRAGFHGRVSMIHGTMRRRSDWFSLAALVLAPLLFVALSIVRAWRNADDVGNYTGCHDCFWLPTFGHDAWLLAILFAALAIACVVRWRWLAIVLRLLASL